MWPFDDLVPWLRARIAEDRLRADHLAEDFTVTTAPEDVVEAVYEVADQRALLAACDAYTAVLDAHDRIAATAEHEAREFVRNMNGPHRPSPEYERKRESGWHREGQVRGAQIAVLGVALAFRHRPDFREEWRGA
ncbi:DUF6221 family protein [Lentzea sp. NPDC092896]|uniref:DUF6221 family protein n=1 Tax=Lentzea sp. NPDC092896 TaxID=3364127 RepID=UPI003812BF45